MNSICFNERQNIWTTRYDWIPLISENIEDKFFSIGGIQSSNNEYDINEQIWKHDCDDFNVTKWFNKQHEFEFEFVVSDPIGVQKIFDNLQIISNNVQPNELEITILGDDYEFKRKLANSVAPRTGKLEVSQSNQNNVTTTSNIHGERNDVPKISTEYKYDERLNQSAIVKWQPIKDIYKYGRRIGNTQYKEDSWYTQIEPIYLNQVGQREREARIRDKWARIRIRYTGEDLAVITAIKTLINV